VKEILLNKNDIINENKYTIYMHKNKINGKIYIGQTRTSVNDRWQDGKGYKGCTLFDRAINKYG
jgi:predicted GIY-YIG superfamily endonuclease